MAPVRLLDDMLLGMRWRADEELGHGSKSKAETMYGEQFREIEALFIESIEE